MLVARMCLLYIQCTWLEASVRCQSSTQNTASMTITINSEYFPNIFIHPLYPSITVSHHLQLKNKTTGSFKHSYTRCPEGFTILAQSKHDEEYTHAHTHISPLSCSTPTFSFSSPSSNSTPPPFPPLCLFRIIRSQVETHQLPFFRHTPRERQRETLCMLELLEQNPYLLTLLLRLLLLHSSSSLPSAATAALEAFPGRQRRWALIRGLYLAPRGEAGVKLEVKVWHGGPSARPPWPSSFSFPPTPPPPPTPLPPPELRLSLGPRTPCPWAHSWRPPLLRL